MDEQTCPECGHSLTRDIRPMTLHYNGLSATFEMPGWYCRQCSESVHDGIDMQESDRQLNLLRERSSALAYKELSKELKTLIPVLPAGAERQG